jgi:hypothetical protein
MLPLLDLGRPDVLGYRIEGAVTAGDVRAIVDELVAKREAHGLIRVYAEIGEIESIELRAILADLSFLIRKLEVLARINRTAVVTDAAWLRRLAEAEGQLLPLGPVRGFATADAEAARAWVVADPDGVEPITDDDMP